MWSRPPGFATMIRFILEQQVSLASADAAYTRLVDAVGEVTPATFLTLDDAALLAIGFSRQKAGYGRELAGGMENGSIDLQTLDAMADKDVMETLQEIRGIGPWTAGCYLLFVLRRNDAWPPGDRALHVAMADVLELDAVPDRAAAEEIAERWRPYRAVAARMLWHEYLGGGLIPESDR